MPASDTAQERRGGRLLTVLFWAGVALAPLAALLLLVGQGEGPLRIAAVLAVLAVVLIGLSITMRRDGDTIRAELEETLLDEIDVLREDVRGDIATAARATHRQFSEKLQAVYESVESLRGHIGVAGGYEHVEAVPHGHSQMPPPHGGPRVGGHVVGGHVGMAGVPTGNVGHSPGARGMAMPPQMGGVVRHTETVKVTTRHTVVDPHADGQSGRGTVYGGTVYGGRAAAPEPLPAQRREPAHAESWAPEPAEESWTEQRLRERLQHGADWPRRSRHQDPEDDPAADEHWAGLRAGDRWASVRTDDRGRELRLGERRAAMHSDESGTELRIEDRWAAMRRDEPRGRRGADDRWEADGRRSAGSRWGTEDRWADDVEDTGRWDERGQRALPSVSSEPSWSQEWGREDDYDDPPERVSARSRRYDFESTDDRWR